MPKRIETLIDLLHELERLLDIVRQCAPVLFDERFREVALPAIDDAIERFPGLRNQVGKHIDDTERMEPAGLRGRQLTMKLQAFEDCATDFEVHGTKEHLEEALSRGRAILGSIAGTIPGVGSFAQELLDFILDELRKNFKITFPWRRKSR